MQLNEPNAELRVISDRLYDNTGTPLALNHVFSVGDLKIIQPDGTIANTSALPTPTPNSTIPGSFNIQLAQSEIQQEGNVKLQLHGTGLQDWEWVEPIIGYVQVGGGGGAVPGATLLSTIEQTVRDRGDYPETETFTPTYVQGEIQAAWSELYELIANTFEGWWDKDTTLTTTANQSWIALPSDCWRVQAIDILDGGTYRELRQIAIGDRNRYQTTGNMPIAYRLSARGAELYPSPTSTTYTLRVTYTPMRAALDDVNGIQFYNDWQEYVVVGTLLRLDQREGIPTGERMAELGRVRERILEAASLRRSQEPEYLQLREPHFFGEWYL